MDSPNAAFYTVRRAGLQTDNQQARTMNEAPAEATHSTPPEDEKLRDSEIAIIDALKMIVEIMVAKGIVPAEGLRKLFANQRDGYIRKEMANAAVVMEVLRTFAVARQPEPERDDLRRALDEPPQGSA
jgi:hypothetical protein